MKKIVLILGILLVGFCTSIYADDSSASCYGDDCILMLKMENPIDNFSFEVGDPPDDWSYGSGTFAQSEVQVQADTYSLSVTRTGANSNIVQDIQTIMGISHYQSKSVTVTVYVWASVADRGRIFINDGIGSTNSSYHTGGSGWEKLSVTRTIDASATRVRVGLYVGTADTTVYFDNAQVNIVNDLSNSSHFVELQADLFYTLSEKMFGDTSGYSDGTGDYIKVTNTADIDTLDDSNDWTVEEWVYPTTTAGYQPFFSIRNQGADEGILVYYAHNNYSGKGGVWYWNGGAWTVAGAGFDTAVTVDAENHLAFVAESGTYTMYIDGVEVWSSSFNFVNTGNNIRFGWDDANSLTGYIDEIRIVKESAIWTSGFTPPDAEYPRCSSRRVICIS